MPPERRPDPSRVDRGRVAGVVGPVVDIAGIGSGRLEIGRGVDPRAR